MGDGYAVVEPADTRGGVERFAGAAPRPAVAGQVLNYGINRMAVAVDAPADGVVVVNEVAFPGWRVTVDGVPAEPLRVDVLLRGVVVSAGRHEIEWRYLPAQSFVLYGVWSAAVLVRIVAAVRRRSHDHS